MGAMQQLNLEACGVGEDEEVNIYIILYIGIV